MVRPYVLTQADTPRVWVVTTCDGRFCHAFDSEDSARKYVLRVKLDKGVRVLTGGIPKFEILGVQVKTMVVAK